MIEVRNHKERGYTNIGWLQSYHSFSFGHYYNPQHQGFRNLLVINEDYVEGGQGFGMHPHNNMEIITYVIQGSLIHKDSLGNSSVLKSGEVQRMSAGTGIVHSEYNNSATDPAHFLQIWIKPKEEELPPSYEQKSFQDKLKSNELLLVASSEGEEGALKIHQDVKIYLGRLEKNQKINYLVEEQRHIWLQVIKGEIRVQEKTLLSGDGIALSNQQLLKLEPQEETEFLLFDLS